MSWFLRLMRATQDEEGQTLVEYALLLALIAVVVLTILTTLGQTVNNTFNYVTSAVGS
ncbi:MAG TPA: Flp family type IVb pilin [Syntrophales bacterium]|nr:Flp family type IVb pilin [Syntrophales bacterium]